MDIEQKQRVAMSLLLRSTGAILEELKKLHPADERVLRIRYGIDNILEENRIHTLEEVGKTLEVTRETIRNIENRAIDSLLDGPAGHAAKKIVEMAEELKESRLNKADHKLSPEEKLLSSIFGPRGK